MKQVINGVETVFVGNTYEVTSGVVTKYYFFGGARVAMRSNGNLYYPLTDHLGSTTVTTDAQHHARLGMSFRNYDTNPSDPEDQRLVKRC